ncbi:MAG: c-type cytochrome [Vicinamibacterales bacterium]|nr:c-type cytochrome [Vicinamibacterales bacterium]
MLPPVPSGLRWMAFCAAGLLLAAVAGGLAQSGAVAPPTDVTQLYDTSCASCHGTDGRGHGPASDALTPRPRDFTSGTFKFRSTASGSLPSDDDLYRAIAHGMPGTSMLGWKGILTEDQIRALADYVKRFSPRFAAERPASLAATPAVPSSPASIEKGRAAYETLGCGACHGDGGAGVDAVAIGLKDDWGHDAFAPSLDEPWSFRGGRTAADVYMRLKSGINGTPMPSFADSARDDDLWHVANYVVSLARKPVWDMTAEELKAHYARQAEKDAASPVQRGRSLVATMACGHCHTPVDREGRGLPGLNFAGGMTMRLQVWGDVVTANLTSDNETGLGRYGDEDIKRAITRGIKHDGSRMLPFPMGWPAYAHLTPQDQDAIVAYLRTLPPVKNQIPPPARPGVFTYLTTKFQMLVGGKDFPIVIFAGNAGSAGNPGAAAAAAQR